MKYKNILFFLILSFFIFSLCYIFYRSEIVNSGLIRTNYIKYYILSFISLLALIFIKNFNEKLSKFFFYFLSILISFIYFCEIFFIYSDYKISKARINYFKSYLKDYGIDYEQRDKFELYLDLKKTGQDISLSVDPYHFLKDEEEIFPLSSFANKETILCNEYGLLSTYKSDRYGFSNPDHEWDNEVDYLLIGDAFAHGNCVRQKDSIAGQLRKMNNGKGVLNLGFGGSGPLIEYAQLREYLEFIKARRVLWLYSETDDLSGPDYRDPNKFEGLESELSNKILKKYLMYPDFSQELTKKQKLINQLLSKKNNKILDMMLRNKKNKSEHKLISFIKLTHFRNYLFSSLSKKRFKTNQKISNEFKKIINDASQILKKKNIEFYFIYITDVDRYSKSKFDITENDYVEVKNFILSNKNIKFIDLHQELFKNYDNEPLSLFVKQFRNDYQHFNILGYKLVTEKIYEIINNN
tara:strand:- start:2194 stop:3594 length:1401 start_codon:yes stop_codon:yes gene_type:complete